MIVLASRSAARAAVLRGAGVAFEVRSSGFDEAVVKAAGRARGAGAAEVATALAEGKAGAVLAPGAWVIGADQMLVCEGRWFDKPRDVAEARAHLMALRGRVHELVTAAVLVRDGAVLWRHVAVPRMVMRGFSDVVLEAHLVLEGASVTETVGGYRVEGAGVQLFDAIEGEWSAVLGVPLLALLGALRGVGALAD